MGYENQQNDEQKKNVFIDVLSNDVLFNSLNSRKNSLSSVWEIILFCVWALVHCISSGVRGIGIRYFMQ